MRGMKSAYWSLGLKSLSRVVGIFDSTEMIILGGGIIFDILQFVKPLIGGSILHAWKMNKVFNQ